MSILRYAPDLPLPPYSYVPGKFPHPVSNPDGHSYHQQLIPPLGKSEVATESLAFRYGVDLFNHGYYWEAHEAWESLWHAVGHHADEADFLKGLIKLAAMGVKLREGNARGAVRHAKRALELLVCDWEVDEESGGLDILLAREFATNVLKAPEQYVNASADPVVRLFTSCLIW